MLENWLVKMTKQLCVSCKKEITNDPGSVIFICPACDKNKIINKNPNLDLSLKEKILKLLVEDKSPKTILQIAEKLKADYKNTFQAVNKLYPDLIYKNKTGSINLIEIKLMKTENSLLTRQARKELIGECVFFFKQKTAYDIDM